MSNTIYKVYVYFADLAGLVAEKNTDKESIGSFVEEILP